MKVLPLAVPGETLKVLCLGAHSDDIEIGTAGTLLSWIAKGVELHVHWLVLSAAGPRREEALAGAAAVLDGAASQCVEIADFRDGYFPYQGMELKERIDGLKSVIDPDVVFTHFRDDAHQDHREVSRLTWNSFRDHVVLEYEIPKWDGDLGQPNAYYALDDVVFNRKMAVLDSCFGTQRSKDWFDTETFRALARLRGMECRAPHKLAEAFHCRKVLLG